MHTSSRDSRHVGRRPGSFLKCHSSELHVLDFACCSLRLSMWHVCEEKCVCVSVENYIIWCTYGVWANTREALFKLWPLWEYSLGSTMAAAGLVEGIHWQHGLWMLSISQLRKGALLLMDLTRKCLELCFELRIPPPLLCQVLLDKTKRRRRGRTWTCGRSQIVFVKEIGQGDFRGGRWIQHGHGRVTYDKRPECGRKQCLDRVCLFSMYFRLVCCAALGCHFCTLFWVFAEKSEKSFAKRYFFSKVNSKSGKISGHLLCVTVEKSLSKGRNCSFLKGNSKDKRAFASATTCAYVTPSRVCVRESKAPSHLCNCLS